MYSLAGYGQMLSDHRRVEAYSEALARAITPGCSVLDIGTGTGFFAMMACRLGAGKVYAIEPDEVVRVARIVARDNGHADRIEFIQDLSTRIDLPEQVDVIVSDLRTVIPWFQHHVATIEDARTRLLKPGGVLIPERDRVFAAMVEMPEFYAAQVGHQPQDTAGFDMSAARSLGTNGWAKTHARPQQLLAKPVHWATLDYRSITDERVDSEIVWTAERSGVGHGFVLWFDTILYQDIGFSNAPGEAPMLYGNAFFPWQEPVEIAEGDVVSVRIRGDLVDGDYFWRWDSRIERRGPGPAQTIRFAQSNLSALRAMKSFRSRGSNSVPAFSQRVEIDRLILDSIDGHRSSQAIAEKVAATFPDAFPSWEAALDTVADLAARYIK